MGHFNNFRTVIYIPAAITARMDADSIEKDFAFIDRYIGLDKVYLEGYRDMEVPKEHVLEVKRILEEKGIEVAGGMTTVTSDLTKEDAKRQRIFGTYCYSNPVMRERVKKAAEYTASMFDEMILDDFYFTNCTCEDCVKAKGQLTWPEFRRKLMIDVSENLIVGPAKKCNPNVKVIIKFPNWRESFHFDGYLPGDEKDIFDAIYTGTETRSPQFTDQHLPSYLSYSLMRWMENAAPGRNGGGWLDTYECYSVDRYLEQAYLTAFSRSREIMLFQWSDLIESRLAAPLGLQLHKIDRILDEVGNPVGVPVYIPYNSDGENHLEMRLGQAGIPIEPTPNWPEKENKVILTASSLADPDIWDKLRDKLLSGGDVLITTGFLAAAPTDKIQEFTEAKLTGRKMNIDRYHTLTDDRTTYLENQTPVLYPELQHGNNASWSLTNGGSGEYHQSIFLRSSYGPGRLYIFVAPENQADINRIDGAVLDPMKAVMNRDGIYVSGNGISMFQYDDRSFILYRYMKDPIHPVRVTVHVKEPVSLLVNKTRGTKHSMEKHTLHFDMEETFEWTAQVDLNPGDFELFQIQ